MSLTFLGFLVPITTECSQPVYQLEYFSLDLDVCPRHVPLWGAITLQGFLILHHIEVTYLFMKSDFRGSFAHVRAETDISLLHIVHGSNKYWTDLSTIIYIILYLSCIYLLRSLYIYIYIEREREIIYLPIRYLNRSMRYIHLWYS